MLASATMSFRPYRRGGGRAAHSIVHTRYIFPTDYEPRFEGIDNQSIRSYVGMVYRIHISAGSQPRFEGIVLQEETRWKAHRHDFPHQQTCVFEVTAPVLYAPFRAQECNAEHPPRDFKVTYQHTYALKLLIKRRGRRRPYEYVTLSGHVNTILGITTVS